MLVICSDMDLDMDLDMDNSVQILSVADLALAFAPACIVIVILYRWSLDSGTALYALARMLIQLVLVGYVLAYLFAAEDALIVIAVLAVMLTAASWIALRPLQRRTPQLYAKALASLALGGLVTLGLIIVGVLHIDPWFWPRYTVPLAGMIFANAMNTVSLAGERLEAEIDKGVEYPVARRFALHAALIPLINSLLAVGIVSLPGMMTGQILSGISPLIAVRYQIMVMAMLLGSGGIAAACFLTLLKPPTAGLSSKPG